MRSPDTWSDLTQIEPDYFALEKLVQNGEIADFRRIPPETFGWHAWDLLPQERLFQFVLPFLRQQVRRAAREMPEIYPALAREDTVPRLVSLEDWHSIPVLVKDDHPEAGLSGFRQAAARNPLCLRPKDMSAAGMMFGSGGSLGSPTPTFLTLADRECEIQAWRRGHAYHGLVPGDVALYTYNTTHKGGQWMQESLLHHGVHTLLRRPEETPVDLLETIRRYRVNVLFTVQQPQNASQSQAKAAGVNLYNLIAASLENPQFQGLLVPDAEGKQQIKFIFLGGFPIVSTAIELLNEYLPETPTATLLGSSEAIPQACSTNPSLTPGAACHLNHLHLLQSPHWVEVLKPEGARWVPVQKGETGLLVYTTWAREGTIYLRYAPGDSATLLLSEGECGCGLHSPVITNVHRMDTGQRELLLEYGCAAG
jgi:phenylacetate-CoA ligase